MPRTRRRSSARPRPAAGKVVTRKVDAPMTPQQRAELEPLLRRVPGMLDVREYLQGLTHDEAQWIIVELSFPRFRKHDEQWVVLGTKESVKPGPLEVHKKDGSSTHVRIQKITKPFKHMGRDMVHGLIR